MYDLAIVGGGIFGAATARDAALRGLRTVLFEKGDVASATSSASSKLVHGGIRYLEHLQFQLVHESLAEQEVLLRIAPHLVRRRAFLVPDEGDWRRPGWYVGVGLRLYDFLSRRSRAFRSRRVSSPELRLLEPALGGLAVNGARLYYDAQVDDFRLTLETLLDARQAGAEIRVRTEVVGLARDRDVWRVLVRPGAGGVGHSETVGARAVVNAAGPWVDAVRTLAGHASPPLVTLSRGAHLLVPVLSRRHAFLLTARADRRVFFVVPQGDVSLVGTTEEPHCGALDALLPEPGELRYLWQELAARWPERFRDPHEVRATFAGVRALARPEEAKRKEPRPLHGPAEPLPAKALGSTPRDERILEENGLLSVAGGKYTTHRAIAERIVNRVERVLGREPTPTSTKHRLLPGAAWGDRAAVTDRLETHLREARAEGLALDWGERDARRLAGLYGSRFPLVLAGLRRFPERADLRGITIHEAEVVHAVQDEWALHLDDVVLRRLGLWRDRTVAERALEPVSRWMAKALGWDESRRQEEIARVQERHRREEALLAQLGSGGMR